MQITLSLARGCGKPSNRFYPDTAVISSINDMASAVGRDHICGSFSSHRRSRENFISADCVVMDCDNDHTDDPEDWIRPEDLTTLLSDVSCIIVPSRNHMKEKNGRTARPRFHVYFPISPITEEVAYAALKRRIQTDFPFFDANALDSARFIFGNPVITVADIIWQEGTITIQDYLFFNENTECGIIPEGSRNSALSIFAARILKRYGNSPEAQEAFRVEAEKCDPPLEKGELRTIWRSAIRFYRRVSRSPDYVKPEEYNGTEWSEPIPFDHGSPDPFPVDALPSFLKKQTHQMDISCLEMSSTSRSG